MDAERGAPYGTVAPKRSFDKVPIQVDWHDYLTNRRYAGRSVSLNYRMRPERLLSTGLQYRCSTSGVTSRVPWGRIPWPIILGQTAQDGSVVWTAEEIDAASIRTTISSNLWVAPPGITLSSESHADMIYQIFVDGGVSGLSYELKHQVTLANAEEKEAVIVLPVQD